MQILPLARPKNRQAGEQNSKWKARPGPRMGLAKGSHNSNLCNIICELISATFDAETEAKVESQQVKCGKPVLNSGSCHGQFMSIENMPWELVARHEPRRTIRIDELEMPEAKLKKRKIKRLKSTRARRVPCHHQAKTKAPSGTKGLTCQQPKIKHANGRHKNLSEPFLALRAWAIITAIIMASFAIAELPSLYNPEVSIRNMCQIVYYDNSSMKICRRGLEGQPAIQSSEEEHPPTEHSAHQTDDNNHDRGKSTRKTAGKTKAERRQEKGTDQ